MWVSTVYFTINLMWVSKEVVEMLKRRQPALYLKSVLVFTRCKARIRFKSRNWFTY